MGKKKDRYAGVVEPEVQYLSPAFAAFVEGEGDNFDVVNKARHYNLDPSGVECIDIVRHRNFNVGSAFKYLWRAGLKEDNDRNVLDKHIEDLKKAVYYIEDEIDRLAALTNAAE